ncbi:MAG: FlgO family outer membrane protein [Campylobacterota bacterium]|nr:FlgO family outer membrane protein [Campylobacterota bacterium]
MLVKMLRNGLVASIVCCATVGFAQGENTIEIEGASSSNGYISPVGSNGMVDDKIIELADSLLSSSRIAQSDMGNIAITSFVDLHNLTKTTSFGRTLAETFFNELFIRGFNVADFRGQSALSVNSTGEFFITRDVKKINKQIANSYVLVGTYSIIDKKVLINARIMDNRTGRVVASAKTYYKSADCRVLGNCPKPRTIRIIN